MYEAFYNLSTKPFSLSPDPRFFFGSSVHKRAMSYLRYGISQGEGFIVITGGIGTGKTTLVRNLFAELDKQRIIAAQLVSTNLTPDELIKMVSSAYGLPYEGLSKASLLKQLETFLRRAEFQDKRVLLVVDEAQNLPAETVEELRMLSNFQGENRSLIQSFLLGQDEFRHTIQSPGMEQLRQRIIASCHLNPLDKDEARSYIEHRLKEVGWSSRPVITDIAFELIHKHTGGVPRRINVFCDRLLLYGYLEELFVFNPKVITLVADELAAESEVPEAVVEAARKKETMAQSHLQFHQAPAPQAPDISKNIKHIEMVINSLEKNMQDKIQLLRESVSLLK